MLRCHNCGHFRDHHEHYRRGTDCSECLCMRFANPTIGWLLDTWERLADWFGRHRG